MKKKPLLVLYSLVIIAFIIFSHTELYARAGGAGGGGGGGGYSGSGSSGGGGGSIGFAGMVAFAIVFGGLMILGRFVDKEENFLEKLQSDVEDKGKEKFIANNPDFNLEIFKEKVNISFIAIQNAWSEKDLTKIRRYISNGVYTRFISQFQIMDMLMQTNVLSNIEVLSVYIAKYDEDGPFDVINVQVTASLYDRFECKNYPLFNSGGNETFSEYWSFIRKKDHRDKDIYNTEHCPNCGATLENLGELSKCAYCDSIVNSGQFDWVLSEITQAEDYGRRSKLTKKAAIHKKIQALKEAAPDFSVQSIEDKASSAYMQIQLSHCKKDLSLIRRFVTDKVYNQLEAKLPAETEVFNRLYLKEVNLIDVAKKDGEFILVVSLRSASQRVIPGKKEHTLKDIFPVDQQVIMLLTREFPGNKTAGTLYTHNCPACGGNISNSLDISCTYCGEHFNLFKNDWIVSDYMSQDEYEKFYQENKNGMFFSFDPSELDGLVSIKQQVLNNLMIIVAADGRFDTREKMVMEVIRKKLGYSESTIQEVFELALFDKLSLQLPNNKKQETKVLKLMQKIAEADGVLSEDEIIILDQVGKMRSTYYKPTHHI